MHCIKKYSLTVLMILVGGFCMAQTADKERKNEITKLLYNVNAYASYGNISQNYSSDSGSIRLDGPEFEFGGELDFAVYKHKNYQLFCGFDAGYSSYSSKNKDYYIGRDVRLSRSGVNWGPYLKFFRQPRFWGPDFYVKAGYEMSVFTGYKADRQSVMFLGLNEDCFRRSGSRCFVGVGWEYYGFAWEFNCFMYDSPILDVDALTYYNRGSYSLNNGSSFRFEYKLIIKLFGNGYR